MEDKMSKSNTVRSIIEVGIVPIIRTSSTEDALRIADAILAGGINTIEITMIVPKAIYVLEKLADRLGNNVLLGAGTVLDSETARAAILAGAEFIVSPHLNLEVIETTRRYSKVSIPAGLTPTEVVAGWQAGGDFIKVFPCGNVGGPKYIKALKAPLPQIEMIPVGGVNLETTADFLKAGAAAVAVGTELVDKDAVRQKQFHIITEKARQFIDLIRKVRTASDLNQVNER